MRVIFQQRSPVVLTQKNVVWLHLSSHTILWTQRLTCVVWLWFSYYATHRTQRLMCWVSCGSVLALVPPLKHKNWWCCVAVLLLLYTTVETPRLTCVLLCDCPSALLPPSRHIIWRVFKYCGAVFQLSYHPGHDDLVQHIIDQAFRHFKYRDG